MSKPIEDFINAIKEPYEEPSKVYEAIVSKVDEEGVIWVNLAGSDKETPTASTSAEVKSGDLVNVEWRNNKLFIAGNYSNPSAGVVRVVQVETTANEAKETADAVEGIAEAAQQSANTASVAAAQAVYDAGQASVAATSAQNSANNANEYASRALGNLSTVQSVAETLAWITEHGTMTLTSDVSIDPTHVYFVRDANGDYTVGSYKYSVVTEPDADDISTYYELSIDESLNNYVGTHLALDTEGLWLLPASSGTNKVLIATGAGSTYTTAGTYIINSGGITVASFRANGATIGEVTNGNSRTEIGTSGMQIYQRDSGNDVSIANLGYGTGNDSGGGTSDAPYYTLGKRATGSTYYPTYDPTATYKKGDKCTYNGTQYVCNVDINTPEAWNQNRWMFYIGNYSHAEGLSTTANGYDSHAEGQSTTACAFCSHAEGFSTTASGTDSHAEGQETTASGGRSHAEGLSTIASGYDSHAEGQSTTASELTSHAEGYKTIASAYYSHAQNLRTIADRQSQTAIGQYNTANNANNLFVVGNGTADNARSDAFQVDTSGNVVASGSITDGSGNVLGNKVNGSASSSSTFTIGKWKIMWGSVTINPSSGTSGSGTYATPYRKDSSSIALSFSATPYVWTQVAGSWTGTNFAHPIDVSSTSFKVRLLSSSTSDSGRNIRWLAIGEA